MAADHVGRHHLRNCDLSRATYRCLLGSTNFFAWRPLCFLQTTLARLCYMLIAKLVELMRDRQIEGLPCELVAPVRLLLEETRVLDSNPP